MMLGRLKSHSLVLAGCLFLQFVPMFQAQAQCLDSCYYTRAELYDFIFDLEASDTRGIIRVDSIGHSRGDMLGEVYPIYAVKVSDNVDVFEDEPVVLIIAHIHAEEVIGIQLVAAFLKDMTARYGLYRALIDSTQLYFIPTMNPDGLEVVSRCLDSYWRKNGYIPPEMNGQPCNISPGPGRDSCGVDLNRNFDLNWIYGDSLWDQSYTPVFDYYRGPAAFSEPEAQAVAAFAEQIKPTLSIVYHSSRQGGVAEQCIVAWKWGPDPDGPFKYSPDSTMIMNLTTIYAGKLPKAAGGTYLPVYGATHNGCVQDWFYRRLGTYQILTELGPPVEIQPACSLGTDTTDLFSLLRLDMTSLNWFCRRATNIRSGNEEGFTPLYIYTKDESNGQPISAEYRNLNTWSPVLLPWYTNEQYGRATILPQSGMNHIMARKEGYVPDTVAVVITPNSYPQTAILQLQPLPWHTLTLYLKDTSGNAIAGSVYLDYDYPKWVDVPVEGASISLPEGSYRAMAVPLATERMVLWRNFYLGGDNTEEFWLPDAQEAWAEDFDNGLNGWATGGNGNAWRVDNDTTAMNFGQSLYTNPTGYRAVYQNNADTWAAYNSAINIPGGNVCYLDFYRRGRLDVPADSFFVEVSTDGSVWQQAAGFCDMELPWTRTFVDLSPWTPGLINVRFRLRSDGALGELGIHVDHLRIYMGTDLNAPDSPPAVAYQFRLTGAYPNPFNPVTTITYEVARPGNIALAIYNILGEEVRRFDVHNLTAGPQKLIWNGTTDGGASVTSGLYIVRMESPDGWHTHKLLLLR